MQVWWVCWLTITGIFLVLCHRAGTQQQEGSGNQTEAGLGQELYDMNVTLSEEKKLMRYLVARYELSGRGGRPVVNMSAPTQVEFGLGLIQMELDEKDKIFTTSMWSRLRWRDVYLTWDPGLYGGVTMIRLEADQVWLPDIMLYNTADPEGAARNALVVVFYDGTMQWVPHQIFHSSCSIDVTHFPFDNQTCHMWFGSWTHSVNDIDLNLAFPEGIDLATFQSDYKDSCEWDIISHDAEKRLLPENDPNPIAVLTFNLHLQRKLVFSSYILTLPCVFLAFLTLVVFWLPPDRPDRTGIAMSLFSSFLVLLLILVEAAPPTASSVPKLGVYYCFNMVIIMMSIFLSSMVVNIHRGGERGRHLPNWVKVIFLDTLGRVFCEKSQAKPRLRSKLGKKTMVEDEEIQRIIHHRRNSGNSDAWRPFMDAYMTLNLHQGHENQTEASSRLQAVERNYQRVDGQLGDVKRTLEKILDNTVQKDKKLANSREISQEWKNVAYVLDRIFCLIYLIIIIISLFFMFPRPPGW